MVRRPRLVLPDKLFQRRRGALGSRGHVEDGTRSKRVLFLLARRERRGGGLGVCLNSEHEEKGFERALPIIAEAIAAGRLAGWVGARCKAEKVETLQTEQPPVEWAKVAAEVRRLALVAAPDCELEIIAAAGRFRQPAWLLDLFVKFAREQQRRWERAPRFMSWVSTPDGKRVLQCNVVLSGGSPLTRRLNTDDREVEGPRRLRLLLWHAIEKGQLPGGFKHEAWHLYGGGIPEKTKCLLRWLRSLPWEQYELHREPAAEKLGHHAPTIDWLTDHEEARRQDTVRRARCDATFRFQGRKTGEKLTPKSRSWQFSRVGTMLHVHSKGQPIYGRVTIDRLTLDWLLPVQNRAAGEAHLKPVVDARKSVKKAADDWRKCSIGSI